VAHLLLLYASPIPVCENKKVFSRMQMWRDKTRCFNFGHGKLVCCVFSENMTELDYATVGSRTRPETVRSSDSPE